MRTDQKHSCVIRTTLVAAAANSASLVALCYKPIMSKLLHQLTSWLTATDHYTTTLNSANCMTVLTQLIKDPDIAAV